MLTHSFYFVYKFLKYIKLQNKSYKVHNNFKGTITRILKTISQSIEKSFKHTQNMKTTN